MRQLMQYALEKILLPRLLESFAENIDISENTRIGKVKKRMIIADRITWLAIEYSR